MNLSSTSLRSFIAVVTAVGLLGTGLAGCGGGGGDSQDVSRKMNMVTVNWIEGMAFTYVQEQIMENQYDMEVDVREVGGGGIAFSSVAEGDRDYFNEAWLPTTHQDPWSKAQENAAKLGYTYKGTSVGLTVPAYMDISSVSELENYRNELGGEINGIESGAAVNDQTRKILENNGLNDEFSVVASSGPATWQALENAVNNEQPIVVTGWYPHWKWGSFDLKYLEGAQTGQSPVFGDPEDVFKIVDSEFTEEFPKEVVCFLKVSEVTDEEIESLMGSFRNRGDMSKREAASQWIENHSEDVNAWTKQAEECAASDGSVETLPDDATYSRKQST
ncbi:glycine betaine ABC transporter substrate-binding protein [Salinibacter ruber]|uniref:Glycine betaine/proline transport system substrate-binding protein n=1 Tax=Salinibacter ruber TaxID=146919 RepID=A0A9X3A8G7_9BACT|nr:glycine betaine ABC transporter substrate-binding protein [Salinibacter ruber]MCS4121798.1 glycine betaine/proline transport system substrate-binding protein [Salinibacter ruber]